MVGMFKWVSRFPNRGIIRARFGNRETRLFFSNPSSVRLRLWRELSRTLTPAPSGTSLYQKGRTCEFVNLLDEKQCNGVLFFLSLKLTSVLAANSWTSQMSPIKGTSVAEGFRFKIQNRLNFIDEVQLLTLYCSRNVINSISKS